MVNNLDVEGSLVFFYYNDLETASRFYGETLGFELMLDREWVKIYRFSEGCHVGLVNGERGSHKPNPIKPVRLQIIVSDAETWFKHLKDIGVQIDREEVHEGEELHIKAFSFQDPEGYTIEICEYTTPYGK